jgi:hypothetical protein
MAILCIPRQEANKLKQGLRNGDIDIAKFFEMTSDKRKSVLEKYISKDLAKFVNTQFEKAMVSNRKTAMADWVETTFKGDTQKKKTVMEEINKVTELTNQDIQVDQIEDLITEKLGVTVTEKELKTIDNYSKKMQEVYDKTNGLSDNVVENYNDYKRFFELQDGLAKYLQSIEPNSRWQIFSSSSGRMIMLMSIKSPILNVGVNTLMKGEASVINRIEALANKTPMINGLNGEFATEYVNKNTSLFWNTGYDTSRMEQVSDSKRILGEKKISAEGPGATRKLFRGINWLVGDVLLGTPDAFYASWLFASKANFLSSSIAMKEGFSGGKAKARALEIFKDSTLIYPKTAEGKQVRLAAQDDAKYFTFTNKSWAQKIGKDSRDWLNNVSGPVRLGDATIPFVNTPANVVATMIDATGITSLVNAKGTVDAYRNGDTEELRKHLRALYMAGLGWLGAWLIYTLLKPEDYIGPYASYSSKEKELIKLKNGVYNSVKIKGRWVSLDYFGPMAMVIAGLMEAKTGKNLEEKAVNLVVGVSRSTLDIPGIEELGNTITGGIEFYNTKNTEKLKRDVENGVVDFFIARTIPALIGDFATILDEYDREARTIGEKIIRKIPIVREKLQPKITLFGEEIKSTGINQLFFGARYKIAQNNDVTTEFNRLAQNGLLPAISNIQYTSTRVKALKEQIGEEKFNDALIYFGDYFFGEVEDLIKTKKYLQASDEEKQEMINKEKSNALDKMLKYYKYKKPK